MLQYNSSLALLRIEHIVCFGGRIHKEASVSCIHWRLLSQDR